MSVNKVILVGRLGQDPETRYMTNGEAVTNCSLATSESWKDKEGNKQEKTEWHNLVFYKRIAEIAGQYLAKGSQIYVEGKLQTRKWQTKEGQDRYSTEVICHELQMLGGKQTPHETAKADGYAPQKSEEPKHAFSDMDDNIPFMRLGAGKLWCIE